MKRLKRMKNIRMVNETSKEDKVKDRKRSKIGFI